MNNDLIARRKIIDSIRSMAEEAGMRGDSYSANMIFAMADSYEEVVSYVNEMEIRERIDRDFLTRHLQSYDKLRLSMIALKARIIELNLHTDSEILKAFSAADISL